MKILWILLALVFIILTLGIVDVEMSFTDGSFSAIAVGRICLCKGVK